MSQQSPRARLALILLAMAALPPAGAQEPDRATVETAHPPLATGTWRTEGGPSLLRLSGGEPLVSLEAATGWTEIVRVRVRVVSTPLGEVAYAPEYDNESVPLASTSLLVTPARGFELVASAAEGARTALDARLERPTPVFPRSVPYHYSYRMDADLPYFHTASFAGERLHAGTEAGAIPMRGATVAIEGPLEVFVTGATLALTTDGRQATHELGASSEPLEASLEGASAGRVDRYAFARVRSPDGRLLASMGGASEAEALVGHATSRLTGTLRAAGADGSVLADGRRYPLVDGGVLLQGDVDLLMTTARGGYRYEVAGHIESAVFLDGRGFQKLPPREAATLAALVVAALGGLAVASRGALAHGVAALYTRLRPGEVLQSDERARLLDAVRAEPGIHLRELQRRLGSGWGKLNYHMRVLERARLLRFERAGKHLLVYPSDVRAASAREVLTVKGAALHVYDAVPAHEGVTQGQLQEHLGLSRQLVSYHLRQLEGAGAVRAVGFAPKRYVRSAEPRPRATDAPDLTSGS